MDKMSESIKRSNPERSIRPTHLVFKLLSASGGFAPDPLTRSFVLGLHCLDPTEGIAPISQL